MIWCPDCQLVFDEESGDVNCPMCGAPLSPLPEGLVEETAEGSLPLWPTGPDGEPEPAVLLTDVADLAGAPDLAEGLLNGYGIPVRRQYPSVGDIGRLFYGFSVTGIDLYVPASRAEEARALLKTAGGKSENGSFR